MSNLVSFLRRLKGFLKADKAWRKKFALYKKQLEDFKQSVDQGTSVAIFACLDDNTGITRIEPHYTYHPAWAARVLVQTMPAKHVDISSTTNFSNIASAFVPFEFYDYRPANIHLSNYKSGRADLTNLHFESNSIESLSCMHTVEHIGLGRYGDPIDINGDKKAMKELQRVLKINGNLLFVVPVGIPKIEFNAHRIYAYDAVIENFNELTLKEFSLIPDDFDDIGYITNPPLELINNQKWGCGCFWFTKVGKI